MSFLNTNVANINNVDTHTNTTLILGRNKATSVDIAKSGSTTTIKGLLSVDETPAFSKRYFAAYSTGAIDITAGPVDITWNVEKRKDSQYTHTAASAEVTIIEAGDYEVQYDIAVDITSGSVQTQSEAALYVKPNAGAYAEVTGTRTYMYSRTSSRGYANAHCATILTFVALDKIKLQADATSGSSSVSTISGGTRILIKKL